MSISTFFNFGIASKDAGKANNYKNLLHRVLNLLSIALIFWAMIIPSEGLTQVIDRSGNNQGIITEQPGDNTPERGRYNVPYAELYDDTRSGNLTDQSAVDIRGITSQFVILAGVVFNSDYECATDWPFRTASSYERTQMLFLASELGPSPKTFNYMELARHVTGSSVVSNFTVKLMHTSASTFTGLTNYVDMSTATTVFNSSSFTIPDGSGTCGSNTFTWMTINFSTNFVYNGTDNLVVEINWGPRTSGTTSRSVLSGIYPEERVIYGYGSSANPARLGNSTNRPNIRFGYQIPVFGTVQDMVNEFIEGCATVSNISYVGDNRAIGFFERRTDNPDFPFAKGIVLSSGQVTDAAGPNISTSKTTQFGTAGDSDIANLGGGTSYDAASLTFDFVPNSTSISFRYIFGSDEYPEWACSQYNDAFGFFISGPGITRQNIALIPGTGTAVEINTIRKDGYDLLSSCDTPPPPACCSDENITYYVTVAPGSTTIEWDGRTVELTAALTGLQPCSTYTMKFVVGDIVDSKWDSGVFLEAGSFGEEAEVSLENFNYEGISTNTLFMVCNPNTLRVSRPGTGDLSQPLDVPLTVSGTAVYGTHHNLQSQTVTIPANQTYVDVPLFAVK